MGRGTTRYLSYTALVLLSAASLSTASGADGCLWCITIDESPAPPPDKGPPFSAHASRNPHLIPYQVIGVCAAYVGSILITGSLLLTIGRKLRKRAQSMAAEPKEMIKPMHKTFDRSPNSDQGNWYSPRRLRGKKSATNSIRSDTSNQMSPGMDSVASFDTNVIEADRARRQEEMEKLYAAVMQHDEHKASQQNVAAGAEGSPPEYQRGNPPRLLTDDPALRHLQMDGSTPQSPGTPRSPIRAIYPPGSSIPPGPASPTSPVKAEYPNFSVPAHSELRSPREARSPSFGSGRTSASGASSSGGKKLRKSLRNLKISGPIIGRGDDNSDGARTPLSPRYYVDPGVPPEPPTSRTTESQQPYTPGTVDSFGEDEEHLDEVRDLPQPNPQRMSAQPATTTTTTTGANGTLPLREMNRQYNAQQQAQAQAAFPLSPSHWNSGNAPYSPYMTSAGPVKTTFLESRRDKLGAGMTPRTGMQTPYSPYMPFTPLTPVTPHLTSRAERKQRQREEKAVRGTITEEDAVQGEGELWDSGY